MKSRASLTLAVLPALALSICPSFVGRARAQQPLEVRRGDIEIKVKVTGTVVAEDLVRLKAAVEGRVEDLDVSTYTWLLDGKTIGYLANKEMALILDSHNTTEKGVLEDRWRQVYQPTPMSCPGDCYVLRKFITNKEWLRPQAIILEAAHKLQAVGRVRPEDATLIKDGQELEFWAVDDPGKKFHTRISHYILDFQGHKYSPGGTFTIDFSPKRYFPPGTEWEGQVVPISKRGVLLVPTSALVDYDGTAYLPIKVSTGITTPELTEITAGVPVNQDILVLDDAKLKDAMRHRPEARPAEIKEQIKQEYLAKPSEKSSGGIAPLPDNDSPDYGEDPYAQ